MIKDRTGVFKPKTYDDLKKTAEDMPYNVKQLRFVRACRLGDHKIVKLLLDAGADVHYDDDSGLMFASKNGHTEVVKLLINAGADIHVNGEYPITWASENGHTEVVKLLINAGADIHVDNDYPIRWASRNDHTDVVKFLLDVGTFRDAPLKYGLEYTVDDDIKRMLTKARQKLNESSRILKPKSKDDILSQIKASTDEQKHNALIEAIKNENVKYIKYCIDAGVDIHAYDDYAFRVAAQQEYLIHEKQLQIVNLLIKSGANIRVKNDQALRYACCDGKTQLVKVLLENGADVHALQDYAIRGACERNHPPVVSLLVNAGADVDAMGGEPLTLVCKNGHHLVAEILVNAGATISVDHLKTAVLHSYANIVKLLINNGVRVTNRILTMAKLIVKEDKLTAPDRNSVYILNMLENIVNMQEKGMKRTRTNESATSILKPKTSDEIVDNFSQLNVTQQIEMLQDNDPDFMVNGSIIPESKWPLIVKIKKALMEDDRVNQVIRTGAIATWSYEQPKYIAAFRIFDKNDHKSPNVAVSQYNNDNFLYVQEMPSGPTSSISTYDELLKWLKEEYIWVDFNF